jgi:hypothetical protein
MKPLSTAGVLLVAPCCLALVLSCWASAPPTRQSTEQSIAGWIEQLGDDDFEVREEATRQLLKRDEALAALRRARQSPDLEVRKRASEILQVFKRRRARRGLDRAVALAKDGQADQVFERLLRWREFDQEQIGGRAVLHLAWKLAQLEQRRFNKITTPLVRVLPLREFQSRAAGVAKKPFPLGLQIEPKAPLSVLDVSKRILVAPGDVRIRRDSGPGVILAGGSVDAGLLMLSVIVCDGTFRLSGVMDNCVIVARGAVNCRDCLGLSGCLIISGGKVELPKKDFSRYITVKENEATPLGFVKFFEPAQVGIEVVSARAGLLVKAVAKAKPFARAGVQSGDAVLALAGTKVASPDAFRKLLRRTLAEGEDIRLTVGRGGKTLDLLVPHKD